MEQRPKITANKNISDIISHWYTRTARNTMLAGPVYQRELIFYGQVKRKEAITKDIRYIEGKFYYLFIQNKQNLIKGHTT